MTAPAAGLIACVLLGGLAHPSSAHAHRSDDGRLARADCAPGCPTVQPGSGIEVAGVPCSAGFLFHGARGVRLLATAGHCVLAESKTVTRSGDRTWSPGKGPEVRVPGGGPAIGRVIYATHVDGESDFALVQLLPRVIPKPQLVGGEAASSVGGAVHVGDSVNLAGQGTGVSLLAPNREGLVSGASQPTVFALTIAAAPGDSGGPVVSDRGAALGLLIRGGGFVVPDIGTATAIRLTAMLARVRRELGFTPRLQTR